MGVVVRGLPKHHPAYHIMLRSLCSNGYYLAGPASFINHSDVPNVVVRGHKEGATVGKLRAIGTHQVVWRYNNTLSSDEDFPDHLGPCCRVEYTGELHMVIILKFK